MPTSWAGAGFQPAMPRQPVPSAAAPPFAPNYASPMTGPITPSGTGASYQAAIAPGRSSSGQLGRKYAEQVSNLIPGLQQYSAMYGQAAGAPISAYQSLAAFDPYQGAAEETKALADPTLRNLRDQISGIAGQGNARGMANAGYTQYLQNKAGADVGQQLLNAIASQATARTGLAEQNLEARQGAAQGLSANYLTGMGAQSQLLGSLAQYYMGAQQQANQQPSWFDRLMQAGQTAGTIAMAAGAGG
jgi:hypothetical protein